MSKIICILIIFILISTVLSIPATSQNTGEHIPTSHIVINEICYNELYHDASWIELYNPTSTPINITNWFIWFYYLNGPIQFSHLSNGRPVVLGPDEYLILCGKKSNFTRWWAVPEGTQIIENGIGPYNDSFHLDNETWVLIDSVYWKEDGQLPSLSPNHSWARYRGGYDTDNFTNDFYDEPHPTPGYENNLGKNPTNPSPPTPNATLSDSKVKLTWSPPLDDGNATITEYRIYRGTSSDSLELIASVNGSTTEYIDSDISKGKTYYYSVSAVNPIGESNLSEVVSIQIPEENPPSTPSLDFVWIIGAMALVYVTFHRKKRAGK